MKPFYRSVSGVGRELSASESEFEVSGLNALEAEQRGDDTFNQDGAPFLHEVERQRRPGRSGVMEESQPGMEAGGEDGASNLLA